MHSSVNLDMTKVDEIEYSEAAHRQAIRDILVEKGDYMSNKELTEQEAQVLRDMSQAIIEGTMSFGGQDAFVSQKDIDNAKPKSITDDSLVAEILTNKQVLVEAMSEGMMPTDKAVAHIESTKVDIQVPEITAPVKLTEDAQMWGEVYHGMQDESKEEIFDKHQGVDATGNKEALAIIDKVSDIAGDVFDGDFGIDGDKLSDFLQKVGRHESELGKYDVQQSNTGEGFAQSYFQIEPSTAADYLRFTNKLGSKALNAINEALEANNMDTYSSINEFKRAFKSNQKRKAQKGESQAIVNYLDSLSKEDRNLFKKVLRIPEIGAIFAGLHIVHSGAAKQKLEYFR